ncbi:PAS domain-containing protein [Sulfurimonas sp. C5]|uniref:PAS domain-containing protein n=1 Tax=Sulfurimonas sp. C5 TaxID=3036947 RepID=UPI0024555F91|nr:PAS domain-containing protein [Sulfurimonas sp. C5]MDH4943780.1 PAS domain-containing protein [Sulfurimonas sp. C5]
MKKQPTPVQFTQDTQNFIKLIEANGDSYWEYHLDDNGLYFSDQIYKTLGYTKDELTLDYNTWKQIVHPDDFQKASEEFIKLLNGEKELYQFEIRVLCKDGTYTWLLDRGQICQRDKDNAATIIAGTHININKTEKLHESIEKTNQQFSSMFDNHDAVMLLVNPQNGSIIDANKSASKFYGYTHEELCNMNITQINVLSVEEIHKRQKEALHHKRNFFIFEHQLKSGEIRTVEVHSSPIHTDDDELLFSIIIDITKEHGNELKLKKVLAQLSQAKKIANLGIWEYDIVNNILTWSDEIYELFELDKEQFTPSYEKFIETIHPDDREKVEIAYTNSLKTKKSYQIVHKLLMKDGRVKYVQEQCDTKYDEQGNPLSSLGTVYDITQLQELTNTINDEKERYQKLMSLASDGILILSADNGKLFEYSEKAKQLLGYTDAEMKELSVFDWDDITHEEYQHLMEIMDTSDIKIERIHKRKDGSTYLASITGAKITLNNQQYVYASVRDITVSNLLRQEQERLLIEQNSLLSLFDKGDSLLFKWKNDEAWSVDYVSENVAKILGYTKQEFQTHQITYSECIHKDDLDKVIQEIRGSLQKNSDYFRHKPYRVVTKSNEVRWLLDYAVTQKNNKGEITHFISYITDITEQKENELELERAKQTADKANAAKSEFLANMSHEIRTPLNGIIGLTDIVLSTNLTHEQREYLNKVHLSSHALLHVINDILDYSKIEAGKVDIVHTEFQLSDLLNTIVDLFSFQIHNKGLHFEIKIDENVPNILIGDSLRLTQILNNLVGNAIKFTSEGFVHIDIKLLSRNDSDITLEFIVQDSGVGIEPIDQKKLFQAFEQGDSSTTRKFGGTGLGLMISKQLTELMGGNIWIKSQVGMGSNFHFTLTFKYKDCPIPEQPSSNENLIRSSSKQIKLVEAKKALLVEDNITNQLVATSYLEHYGFIVFVANNGAEAVDMTEANEYDIIFMDLQMPVMDGFDAAKEIRKFDQKTPIVALSAATMQLDKVRTQEAGMNNHIAKPINKVELECVISHYFAVEEVETDKQIENELQINGINLTKMEQNLAIDKESIYRLYQNFYTTFSEGVLLIDKLYTNDLQAFYAFIHKLKGASGNLQIDSIYKQCIEIEEMGTSIEGIKQFQQSLETILEEIATKILPLLTSSETLHLTKEGVIDKINTVVRKLANMQYIDQKEITTLLAALKAYIDEERIFELSKLFGSFDDEAIEPILKSIAKELMNEH